MLSSLRSNGVSSSREPVKPLSNACKSPFFVTAENFVSNFFNRRNSGSKILNVSPMRSISPPLSNFHDNSFVFENSMDSLSRKKASNIIKQLHSSNTTTVGSCKHRVKIVNSSTFESAPKTVIHQFQRQHERSRSLNSSPVSKSSNPGWHNNISSDLVSSSIKCDSIPEESEEDLAQLANQDKHSQPLFMHGNRPFPRYTPLTRSARFGDDIQPRRRSSRDPVYKARRRNYYHSAPPEIYWPEFLESLAEEDDVSNLEKEEDEYYSGAWFGSGNDLYIKHNNPDAPLSKDIYEPIGFSTPLENVQNDITLKKEAIASLQMDKIHFADSISCNTSPEASMSEKSMKSGFHALKLPHNPVPEYLEMPQDADCPKQEIFYDEDLALMSAAVGLNPPKADMDTFSTLDGSKESEELAYEEAWDKKLQRKLNLYIHSNVENNDATTNIESTYVNENQNGLVSRCQNISSASSIQRNPEASAFRLTKQTSPQADWKPEEYDYAYNSSWLKHQQINIINNLKSDFPGTSPPAIPRHQSNLIDAPMNSVFQDRPLEENPWYHTKMNRMKAETVLLSKPEGTFLIRPSETKTDEYALSIAHGGTVTHMLIAQNEAGKYVLGRYSSAYDSIQSMIGNFLSRELRVQNSSTIKLTHPYLEDI